MFLFMRMRHSVHLCARNTASMFFVAVFFVCMVFAATSSAVAAAQKAFPTAEGFGQYAAGGRGGAVIEVTNLHNFGVGSLRACAEASGPRTCVFRVSGTIEVNPWIIVKDPYLTIAGQTSPGGIAIKLAAGNANAPILVQKTHDIIIRHLRLRPGPTSIVSTNGDTIQITDSSAVILDHMSTSWPTDEGINVVSDKTHDVTIQWSLLTEGLNESSHGGSHSRGTYFGYGAQRITFHHNLLAHNVRRNPLINTTGQFDLVNNVVYNSEKYNGEFATRFGPLMINMIGNTVIAGPSTPKHDGIYSFIYYRDYPASFSLYAKDNIDIHRRTNSGDERLVAAPRDWKYMTPTPVAPLSLAASSVTEPVQAYWDVLAYAGATVPLRDTVDDRVVSDVLKCTGKIINSPDDVGGYPVFANTVPLADSDHDGMPDSWESSHGLNASDASDRNGDKDSDGYTNLEDYLNDLAGDTSGLGIGTGTGAVPDPTCRNDIKQRPALPEVEISASPASIQPGETSVISWTSTNTKSCRIELDGKSSSLLAGSENVSPAKTTSYQVDCVGNGGSSDVINSVLVSVAGSPAPYPVGTAPSP
jgi:pectate lyase